MLKALIPRKEKKILQITSFLLYLLTYTFPSLSSSLFFFLTQVFLKEGLILNLLGKKIALAQELN
jgi:hypothetical protein